MGKGTGLACLFGVFSLELIKFSKRRPVLDAVTVLPELAPGLLSDKLDAKIGVFGALDEIAVGIDRLPSEESES